MYIFLKNILIQFFWYYLKVPYQCAPRSGRAQFQDNRSIFDRNYCKIRYLIICGYHNFTLWNFKILQLHIKRYHIWVFIYFDRKSTYKIKKEKKTELMRNFGQLVVLWVAMDLIFSVIRWISDRNRIPNKLAYYIEFSYSYTIKIPQLYVIS